MEDSLLPFSLPSVERKKVTAAFDGGRLSASVPTVAQRCWGWRSGGNSRQTRRESPLRVHAPPTQC